MKKAIAIFLIALAVVSLYLFLDACQQDKLGEEFADYLRQESFEQGVTAEYLLESGQITFEDWVKGK